MSEEKFKEELTKKKLLEDAAIELLEACELILRVLCVHEVVDRCSNVIDKKVYVEHLTRIVKKAKGEII